MRGKIVNGELVRLKPARAAKVALATAVAASALAIPAASPASAQVSKPRGVAVSGVEETCKHHGRYYIVRQYFRGPRRFTLRCGTPTWGWKHIKKGHGWSRGMDSTIGSAIANGTPVTFGFSIFTNQCPPREWFRTIIGTPGGINDVLTAYNVTSLASASKC
ncbi:hypothetical protein [Streptomyces sioyaensis]|uniref:hypothetical protein n=1 Tax=Streptomyces sioyaensis TaxID=67364 RepID=UPI001F1FFA46|nr:hypothetical protein [Streptomyces sioyaensis]